MLLRLSTCLFLVISLQVAVIEPASAASTVKYCLSLKNIDPQVKRFHRQIKAAGSNKKRVCNLLRRALRVIRRGDKVLYSKRCNKLIINSGNSDAKRQWNWAKGVYRENYRIVNNAYRKHCR